MATYGYDAYGLSVYGPTAPTGNYPGSQITIPVVNTAYILPDLQAQAQDYENILVSWGNMNAATMATVTEFRLLSSGWGFPVDQNDGTIVLDLTGAPPSPGTSFLDTTARPGTVQYYGFYVLSGGVWLRAGFTACLLPKYYGYDVRLMSDLPPYFQNQDLGTLTTDVPVPAPNVPASGGSVTNPYGYQVDVWLSEPANVMVNGVPLGTQTFFPLPGLGTVTVSYAGTLTWQWIDPAENAANTALADFLSILGFGLDTVKTQYDMKFGSLNSPMTMSLGDLQALAGEIGMPFNPELPAYTLRKAALYWGRVMQKKGTLSGIAELIGLLTGYAADVQVSRNIMLDNDQSAPETPVYPSWSSGTHYNVGEIVQYPVASPWSIVSSYGVGAVVLYNGLLYTCILANSGQPPTNVTYWSQNVLGPFDYDCIVANQGNAPSGSTSANTWWSCLYGGNKNGSLFTYSMDIAGLPGHAGTWEFLESGGTELAQAIGIGFPAPQTWVQSGTSPVTGPNGFANTYRALNNSGSTQANTWLRSVARSSADITATHVSPDPQLVVEHAVPVPVSLGAWSSTHTYHTGDIATYQNLNYIALRQSLGATPLVPGVFLNSNYDFESNITPWTANTAPTGTTFAISQSTTHAYHGTGALLATYTGTATAYTGSALAVFGSESINVIPGGTYQVSTLVFGDTTGSRMATGVNFYDVFGTFLTSVTGTTQTLTASTWTVVTQVVTVPVTASKMAFKPVLFAPVSNASGFTFNFWFDVTGITAIASPEWAPLGADSRVPVTQSGYALADLFATPTVNTTFTPFTEWYDSWGNLITRVFARSPSISGGFPTGYAYDSFDTGAGMPLAGRLEQVGSNVWSVPVGSWNVSTYGDVYAGSADADSIGSVPSVTPGIVGATVTTAAQAGDDCGPMWWFSNTSNFWVAGLLQLYYVSAGTTRTVAYTGTLPAVGDRIIVQYNNTTSTTTLLDSTTVIGPSVVVHKNKIATANRLLVIGSGGTATQVSMGSLTSPSLPGTGATTSNAGIASIAV